MKKEYEPISIKLEKELKEHLTKKADKEYKSLTQVVRELIVKDMKS